MAITWGTPEIFSASASSIPGGSDVALAGGSRVLAFMHVRNASTSAPTTAPAINGISLSPVISQAVPTGGTRWQALYELPAASAPGAGTYSITASWDSADRISVIVVEVYGDAPGYVDTDVGQTTSSAVDVRTVTTTATNQAVVSSPARSAATGYTYTTNPSDEIADGGASGAITALAIQIIASASSPTTTWTSTAGTGTTGSMAAVLAEAAGGTTVDLTGSSITATLSAGTVVPDASIALTGSSVTATLSAGTVSPDLAIGLTGEALAAALSAGTVTVDAGGTVVNLTGSQISAVLSAGTLAPEVTAPLTGSGVTATATAGSASAEITVPISGEALAAALASGQLTPAFAMALSGAALGAAVSAGSVSVERTITLTGAALSVEMRAGNVTVDGTQVGYILATIAPRAGIRATIEPWPLTN